uniref:Desmoplakin n=1 Tax=Callorhinchus milii TaxID=7868 RepID=A0A4W3J3Q7_CALMI
MGVQEWALDAVSVEEQIKEQKRYHKIIEDFRWKINKVKVEQNENYSENYRLAISEVEDQYEGLLKGSNERIDQLIRFQDIIKVASNEIMWINDREEEELVYDWSDKNTNIAEKQERFSMLMSNLEVKEKQLNRLKQEGDKLVANQHPAANRIEAYVDALQTQWSWVLQLTKCIEVHLKENTNYFQFFEEAQMVEKDLKKMQDSIRKKFICDKSTPALQLEKMITESEKDKDKILEYKRQMTNLVNKSKNIVQLKPRNPLTNADQRSGNKIILKALCDYKQDQKAVHKDDKCILLDNSQRSKWKVIGPGGIEMMVPSVCLLIPPPNHAANDLANKIEQYYEAILSLWNQLYINMKSLMSWQYCIMDMQKIRSWTLLMLKQMSREDYETVTKNLELNFQAFLKYSKTSQFFTEADRTELQKDYSHSQTHFSKLVTSLEDGPPDRQIKVLGQGPPQSDSNFHLALQTIRHRLEENEQLLLQKIHLLIDSASTFNNTRRTAELEVSVKQMKVLNLLIQSILEVEDIVKVYEARLTEEESVPLDLDKIEPYRFYLKTMRGELDMKRDLLKHMDDDLNQVLNINERITSSYKCDIDIDKYNEKVTQLKDRWQRIYKELDSRYLDLDKHHRQLNDYKQLFDGLNRWIDVTKCKQDALQINKFGHAEAIIAQLQEQKVYSICDLPCDYELQLASFSAGLETLLKIPIKRQVAQSASTNILRESADLQSRYIELLTRSGDYYKCLSEMLKNTEEVKIKNTKIELLEEELKHAKGENADSSQQKKFFDQHLSQIQVEITELRKKVVILEEQRRSAEMERDNAKHSLEVNISQMKEINEKITRLTFELEEERRLRISSEKLKIEQKDEHDSVFHIKQKELDDVIWLKVQIEKTLKEKEHEIQRLRKLLEEESNTRREIESELVKIKNKHGFEMTTLKSHYETQIKISESTIEQLSIEKDDTSGLKIKLDNISREKSNLQEEIERDKTRELERVKVLLEEEIYKRKNLENDNDKLKQLNMESQKKTTDSFTRIHTVEEEYKRIKMDYERASNEKNRSLQEIERLQSTIREANHFKVKIEEEIAQQKRYVLEESSKRKKAEEELECIRRSCKEYTITISQLTQQIEQISFTKKKLEDDLKEQRISFEHQFNEKKVSTEELNRLYAEIEKLRHQLTQEQDNLRQAHLRNEHSEITRLEEELRMLEERCKWKLATADREKQSELEALRIQLQMEIQRLSEVPKKEIKLLGIRDHVSLHELVNSEVIDEKTASDIETGRITAEEVSHKYQDLLQGKSSIAGIFVEATREKLSVYQAMRKGLIRRGTALELLEAQAATGHMIDPVKNLKLTVEQAAQSGLIGLEFKNKLLSAEKAVTGYKDPETGKLISLFQAMKKELIEPTHGIRLLEAQIATGGIIDPTQSHRLPVHTAYKRNYFDEEMNQILIDPGDDTKGFFDPNTEENLTYLQLMERCVTDKVTNLCLLQLTEKKKTTTSTSAVRKRRIVIVDPDTNREMSVREAYHKDLIDYETFVELSEQEAEWEEITISGSDGSVKTVVVDRKTGIQYDIEDYLKKGLIDKKSFDDYRAGVMSLTQFAELFSDKTNVDTRNVSKLHHSTNRSPSPSPQFTKTLFVSSDEFSPIAAIFDIETLEKITISEAVRRNIVDSITGQRLLEAQACTGGIINPGTNQKLLIQDSIIQGIIDEDMGKRLKPAQKAFVGFEDVKNKKKLSAAEAIKENWLPYEAGNRFLEYQFITGGLVLPNVSGRIPVEEAIRKGLISGKTAQKLQDFNSYSKNLTCPKTKLKISYKEAMDRSMVEEKTGLRMLEASSFSSKGINSPYNLSSSGPNSRSGSRSGSRGGSRRGSFDATSSTLTTSTSTTFVSNISVN